MGQNARTTKYIYARPTGHPLCPQFRTYNLVRLPILDTAPTKRDRPASLTLLIPSSKSSPPPPVAHPPSRRHCGRAASCRPLVMRAMARVEPGPAIDTQITIIRRPLDPTLKARPVFQRLLRPPSRYHPLLKTTPCSPRRHPTPNNSPAGCTTCRFRASSPPTAPTEPKTPWPKLVEPTRTVPKVTREFIRP
ncbi:hypothetical protein IWX49DRAFT_634114 [Phyllosticta citricarpa]|uniref:Uncharacterized protein n=1 Tax=Phyllosticta citricarpa TaxID=55181 RepID=A0ABR1M5N6_9PEZI